jgi:hypothetical protein
LCKRDSIRGVSLIQSRKFGRGRWSVGDRDRVFSISEKLNLKVKVVVVGNIIKAEGKGYSIQSKNILISVKVL